MLKISLHATGSQLRMKLEGRLEGAWVPEFEKAFEQVQAGRDILVDLNAVTFIDEAGKQALAAAHRAGARLEASLLMTSAVVDEIRK